MRTLHTLGLVALVLALPTVWATGAAAADRDQPKPAVSYPPPESKGGWRSLVPANDTPTAEQKKQVLQATGLDTDQLLEAWNYSKSFGGTNNVVVIRHGQVAAEWGATPRGYQIASATKSLTALALARLFDLSDAGKLRKKITIDDEAYRFLPEEWARDDPKKKQIKIRHLLTMSSGLEPHDRPNLPNYGKVVLSQPVQVAPETEWAYASVPCDLLSLIVENVTGQTLAEFFNQEINAALGAAPVKWSQFDRHNHGSCNAVYTARDLARVGYLTLHKGIWDSGSGPKQVVSAERVALITQWAPFLEKVKYRTPNFAGEPDANLYYGHLWWTNRTQTALGRSVPRDAYFMSGYRKCACFVIPSLDLVIVRLGTEPRGDPGPVEFYSKFLDRVMAAVTDLPVELKKELGKTERPAAVPAQVERWDTHEITLFSRKAYANPFRDVEVTATFTHAGSGKEIMVPGFSDGDAIWRVRFLPAETGRWTYVTRSADPELNGKKGALECVKPVQPYLNGPIRAEGGHFVHADGTRRFPISTRLSCQFADPAVRRQVVEFLKEAGINRVLFIMGGVHGTVKELYGAGPDFGSYDVKKFRAIDAFIDELRRHDILAAPYFYYFNDRVQCGMTAEQDRAFLRYGMARFGAYANVMPVLANEVEQKHTRRKDERYNLKSHAWANEMGPFLKRCAIFGQPVTVHNPMETDLAVRPGFYTLLRDWPFPWADYMLRQAQVGALGAPVEIGDDVPENKTPTYNARALARHNQLLGDLRRFQVPVINEEPGYEMAGLSWDGKKRDPRPWNSQTADSLRATFWTTTTAGAYTMWGSLATYELGDPLPKLKGSATPRSLKVLAEVMAGLPYWEMQPANERVAANPVAIDGKDYRTHFALAKPGVCYLVYASRGGEIEVMLEKGDYTVTAVDPRTGAASALGKAAGGKYTARLPRDRDGVLVFKSGELRQR